jgi:threonine dehydrogenase-like Zn-dependent dehydrogenase
VHRLQCTIIDLAAQGRIDLRALVSHITPATDAAEAFSMLDQHPEDAVQVLLDFREL